MLIKSIFRRKPTALRRCVCLPCFGQNGIVLTKLTLFWGVKLLLVLITCGNSCLKYPFELIFMYSELRKRDDLLSLMEACQMRSDKFEALFETRKEEGLSEDDAEDRALHDYFAWWRSCPFSNGVGDCTVYPLRTVSCRMYFSETDPKYCTPDMLQTEKNDSYIVYMPDVVEDAVYGISEHYAALDLPESFFGGLLALNGYEGVLGA